MSPEELEAMDRIEDKLVKAGEMLANATSMFEQFEANTTALVAKARNLVELMDDAERNHGGLWGSKTMRASNELRLELQKWGEK